MNSLSRDKLAAILSRLESPFDGERAAAGLLAAHMVRAAGLSWAELIATPSPSPSHPARAPTWRDRLAACNRRRDRLTEWETAFCDSIRGQAKLSKKQFAILSKIARKARG